MDKLIFATAGIPLSTPNRNTINGIKRVRELGLGAMELEFVQSVNVTAQLAPQVRQAAQEAGITLTCHGSYFINLNAVEKQKFHASIARIVQAGSILTQCGGYSLTFHAAYYLKSSPLEATRMVIKGIEQVNSSLEQQGAFKAGKIWIRPETTGKGTQWGTLEEIIGICGSFDNVLPCIDYSHLHARTGGRFNTEPQFASTLDLLEKNLGKLALKNMHMHIQGVEYTEKGERSHIPFSQADFNYHGLLKVLKEYGVAGVAVCESPAMEADTLILQKAYNLL
ncbi:TIM barrel protein [Candidatus Parvarchaeota archaeon]|nr:TIM barrel protein [Candidatus Parvarchaeota archaeon]